MRKILIAATMLALFQAPAWSPAWSQGAEVDRRVDRIERQVRALQRQVFPGGDPEFFEADIQPGQTPRAGTPASAPLTDLTDRVNSLERQLQTLTGQIEQNTFQLRQLRSEVAAMNGTSGASDDLSGDSGADIQTADDITGDTGDTADDTAVANNDGGDTASTDDATATDTASSEPPLPADPGEASYVQGYRLWRDGNFEAARTQLRETVENYPGHRFESFARNLLGRAYLDDDKPANATEIFVRNYQELPNGDRAADSLFFLGVALTELEYNERACLAFAELMDVYGETLRSTIAEQVPAAREAAGCN